MNVKTTLALALLVAVPALPIADPLPSDVVPIGGEAPAWWTPDVQEKTIQAGRMGLGYDFVADDFVNVSAVYPSQLFIRPGTQILVPTPASASKVQVPVVPKVPSIVWCTAAFVYGKLPVGYDAISTAGHCTKVGDPIAALAAPSVLVNIGQTVSSTGDGGLGNDWAVIDIFPQWEAYADADVAWLAGPCGSVTTNDPSTLHSDVVKHVGHGLGIGTGGTPRVGRLESLGSSLVVFTGATMGGDSGSPILLSLDEPVSLESCAGEGQALAILTHTSTSCGGEASVVCLKYGTRVTLVPGDLANGNLRLD